MRIKRAEIDLKKYLGEIVLLCKKYGFEILPGGDIWDARENSKIATLAGVDHNSAYYRDEDHGWYDEVFVQEVKEDL